MSLLQRFEGSDTVIHVDIRVEGTPSSGNNKSKGPGVVVGSAIAKEKQRGLWMHWVRTVEGSR